MRSKYSRSITISTELSTHGFSMSLRSGCSSLSVLPTAVISKDSKEKKKVIIENDFKIKKVEKKPILNIDKVVAKENSVIPGNSKGFAKPKVSEKRESSVKTRATNKTSLSDDKDSVTTEPTIYDTVKKRQRNTNFIAIPSLEENEKICPANILIMDANSINPDDVFFEEFIKPEKQVDQYLVPYKSDKKTSYSTTCQPICFNKRSGRKTEETEIDSPEFFERINKFGERKELKKMNREEEIQKHEEHSRKRVLEQITYCSYNHRKPVFLKRFLPSDYMLPEDYSELSHSIKRKNNSYGKATEKKRCRLVNIPKMTTPHKIAQHIYTNGSNPFFDLLSHSASGSEHEIDSMDKIYLKQKAKIQPKGA